MKTSLRKRFALSFLLTVFMSILITSMISNYRIDKKFDEYLLEEHQKKIDKVKSLVEELYDPKNTLKKIRDNQIQRYAVLEDLYIQINDIHGNMVFSSGQSHLVHKKMMGSMMKHMMKKQTHSTLTSYKEEEFPIIKNRENIGTIVIGYFGTSNFNERDIEFKNTLNQSFLVSGIITFILGFIMSIIMSKGLTTPLGKITKIANEMRNGNLKIRSTVNSNTREIEDLSKAINYLAQTLQKQEKLRKRLTSDMAHEIRTPLTTLQAHVEAIIDGIWEPTSERLQSCHEEILRLKKLVNHLQDLARLEQGNLNLNKTYFNLSNTIEKVIDTFKPQYRKKNLKTIVNISPNIEVFMDEDKVKQILFNLLSNSYKYSNDNGVIEIGLIKNEKEIILWIRDEGIGISKEHVSYIFERFYRGDTSRSRETGGTGIGLTITKTLIEAHGGKIKVDSEVGKGTTFVITFIHP